MLREEYGKPLVNPFHGFALPQKHITNIALEMCVSNMVRQMQLVAEHGGFSLTFDLRKHYGLYTARDIREVLVHSGYQVIVTLDSSLQNRVRLTVVWKTISSVT